METYIGAEYIASPLGFGAKNNFEACKAGKTGIQKQLFDGIKQAQLPLAKWTDQISSYSLFDYLLGLVLEGIQAELTTEILTEKDTLVIISSTKGNIDALCAGDQQASLSHTAQKLQRKYNLYQQPLVLSQACISGTLALIIGADFVKNKHYKYVFVIGADVISKFVVSGFQCLYALDEDVCKPFDQDRKGLNLGEGAAGVLISASSSIYSKKCMQILGGANANDANHISGPSRTGEGLQLSIKWALERSKITAHDVDIINVHGTGTPYNDEMESKAYHSQQLDKVMALSLKGYFGHTLGAAGLIESVIGMQALREEMVLSAKGLDQQCVTYPLNLSHLNRKQKMTTMLKTAAGFGGVNAALIIQKQ